MIKVADSSDIIVPEEKRMLMYFISEVMDIREDKLLSPPTADK